MVKLSKRLQTIADEIHVGEKVADIGTDHGLLPIFLYENAISPFVVLVDINEGPLKKAKDNIARYAKSQEFDLRLGSGLEPLQVGEVDTVVIAGMGGLLMCEILQKDLQKTKSYGTLILQPRNAPEKLRRWLLLHGFAIKNEVLVEEGRFLCEVIVAQPQKMHVLLSEKKLADMERELEFEINPLLFEKEDPLLAAYLGNKIRVEKLILKEITLGVGNSLHERCQEANRRIFLLTEKWNQIKGGNA